jgi:beta-aspartyl-peptidase (threonine type)
MEFRQDSSAIRFFMDGNTPTFGLAKAGNFDWRCRMRSMIPIVFILLLIGGCCKGPTGDIDYGLVIHGGAGTILREQMTPELEEAYHQALNAALQAGYKILQADGSAVDAVVAAITILEDSPLFNAGKGAVFNSEGRNELDASIMDGRTRSAGAVAGVSQVKNPILLARLVMKESPYVMMAGPGAEEFGRRHNIELVEEDYFYTQPRWEQYQARRRKKSATTEEAGTGTVGAVARDKAGNLAAGTSTGGMTNKKFGRIGDSPIIGAGTYADNQTCAVSATGHGEYFIRSVAAYDIAAQMAYQGRTLTQAADITVLEKIPALGGHGGVIAIDKDGHIAMPFSTHGMYRGIINEDGRTSIWIYKN